MNDYKDIAERFAKDTANHEMTVLHEDGFYRHLKFTHADHGSFGAFHLITWPYNLVVKTGWTFHFDIDATEDIFEVFRRTSYPGEINPDYWQEKVRAGRGEIVGFDGNVFEREVKQHVADAIRSGRAPRGLSREVLREIFEWGDISHEDGARAELDAFSYEGWKFGETWEWDFTAYTPGFLWSCFAIRHGIAMYDASRAKAVAA
jgi:hypothetical protein